MLKKGLIQNDIDSRPDLGATLRGKRKELGLTMQFVADEAGLSVGFISQVERGITLPSISSLVSIAEVLKTPIATFLDKPTPVEETTRGEKRESFSVAGGVNTYERLSTSFEGSKLNSVIATEPPGYRGEPVSHRGEEMFYILDGEITVEIEGSVQILRPGDSIHFDSNRTHSTWNHTESKVSFLWCGTMDLFGNAPDATHNPTHKNMALNEDV